MNSPPVILFRCRWLWPVAALLCGVCHTPAEELPPPRVLTAAEWAGVQASHDDPSPAVRAAAEAMRQRGLGAEA